MHQWTRSELQSLGIDTDVQPSYVTICKALERSAGFGFTSANPYRDLPLDGLIAGPLTTRPEFDKVSITPDLEARWWQLNPGVIALEPVTPARFNWTHDGTAKQLPGGELVLDVRTTPQLLRASSATKDLLLRCTSSGIEVFAVPSTRLGEAPPLQAVLPNPDAPPWLRSSVERYLARATSFDVAIALGLAARFASPPQGLSMEQLLSHAPTDSMAIAWMRQHAKPDAQSILSSLMERATILRAALDGVESAIASDAPDAHTLALEWLHQRDDLECVVFLLERAEVSDSSTARHALRAIDDEATTRQSMWALLPDFGDDDRLREVSWQEPDAWWGSLAVG